jgi:hypothetical protein
MSSDLQDFPSRLTVQAEELIGALAHAEKTILTTIERECEALRAQRMLAAKSLHDRLCEVTQIYLNCARAARTSMDILERALPGCRAYLEERRAAFSPVLQIQLAVLGAQRAAAEAAVAEREYLAKPRCEPAEPPLDPIRSEDPQNLSRSVPSPAKPQGRTLPAYPRSAPSLRVG